MPDRRYWLFKSKVELDTFNSLIAAPNQTLTWTNVRNPQARNFMRDGIQVGDDVLFYHSSASPRPPGVITLAVVGTATVTSAPYPDPTDPDSQRLAVDIKADHKFDRPVTLQEIKQNPNLAGMMLHTAANQLSIQPVTEEEFYEIVALGGL